MLKEKKMTLKVSFTKSDKVVNWNESVDNLLELAEDHDIPIESDCRWGYFGTCKTRLLSGEVDMELTDGLEDEDLQQHMILPCVAAPKTDVDLEA
jgi:uncharacterized protein